MKNRNKTRKVAARILAGMLATSFILAIVSMTLTVPVMAGVTICDESCFSGSYVIEQFHICCRYDKYDYKYCNIDPTNCVCTGPLCKEVWRGCWLCF